MQVLAGSSSIYLSALDLFETISNGLILKGTHLAPQAEPSHGEAPSRQVAGFDGFTSARLGGAVHPKGSGLQSLLQTGSV